MISNQKKSDVLCFYKDSSKGTRKSLRLCIVMKNFLNSSCASGSSFRFCEVTICIKGWEATFCGFLLFKLRRCLWNEMLLLWFGLKLRKLHFLSTLDGLWFEQRLIKISLKVIEYDKSQRIVQNKYSQLRKSLILKRNQTKWKLSPRNIANSKSTSG